MKIKGKQIIWVLIHTKIKISVTLFNYSHDIKKEKKNGIEQVKTIANIFYAIIVLHFISNVVYTQFSDYLCDYGTCSF
jgi:hypothetical protein